MQLTLQTDYALRTLLYLALHPDEVVPVSTVSDAYGISVNHVAKVAKALTRGGFVRAKRGKGGGLQLAYAPKALSLGAVVRAMEPELSLLTCFEMHGDCPITGACRLRKALIEARDAFLSVLDEKTLEDLLENGPVLVKLLGPTSRKARVAVEQTSALPAE